MFGLGFSEIMVLAVLGLILLGPEQLPDIARTLGRFINDLKRSTEGLSEEFRKQGFGDGRKLLDEIRRDTQIDPPNLSDAFKETLESITVKAESPEGSHPHQEPHSDGSHHESEHVNGEQHEQRKKSDAD